MRFLSAADGSTADPFLGNDGKAGCAALVVDPSIPEASYPQVFSELYTHVQKNMPKYAVPVFLRVLRQTSTMHNNKQNKQPLKKDGYDLDRIYGPSVDVDEARKQGKDIVMWCPAALGQGAKSEGYIPFRREDWEKVRRGGEATAQL